MLDVDIRRSSTTVNHDWMRDSSSTKLPTGAFSPLLANVYLNYVFDVWMQRWRRRGDRGAVIVVCYADDSVAGFESRADAERFLSVGPLNDRTRSIAYLCG